MGIDANRGAVAIIGESGQDHRNPEDESDGTSEGSAGLGHDQSPDMHAEA
jgi:hypothetical protein